MFKNYFKIAFRSAAKHKAYSFINLSGLAIGLTSFILITLYIQHQLSYHQFHENKDRIFRVNNGEMAITPNIISPLIKRNFQDEVAESVRLLFMNNQIFNLEETAFTSDALFSDPGFFSMFSFPLVRGDKEKALRQPNSLVISQSAATLHFGTEDVMGKTLEMSGRQYTITGILEDIPENSLLQFNYVAPINDMSWTRREHWSNWSYHTFVQLADGVVADQFEQKLSAVLNEDGGNAQGTEDYTPFFLQSLNDIYLQTDRRLTYEISRTGDIKYVYIFFAVAVLILMIACINYVNLATSKSLERAKEVGIRKVVGAQRGQLIYQFLGESFLFVFLSLTISIVLSILLFPYFNQLSGVTLSTNYLMDQSFILQLIGLGLVISLLAGIYPALMLSTFRPVSVLKGSFKNSGAGGRLRKVLVVFQFAISAFLLVSTLVVNKQLGFIQSKKLGYDREQVLYFRMTGSSSENFQTLKTELLSNPNVKGISLTSNTPLNVGSAHGIKTGPTDDDYELIYYINVDENFIDVMEMNILAGIGLEERAVPFIELDSIERVPSIIINETTANLFDWSPKEAIGKKVTISGYEAPVQAVVQDFHFKSIQTKIEPFVMLYNPDSYYYGIVRLGNENMIETIGFIEDKVKAAMPKLPFDYQFLDDRFDRMYRFESRLSDVFLTFASIAIIIACLGMFGLISFMALNRAKEIGIRKVLGASVPNIIILLSTDFLKLILIALLLSLPIAYYVMGDWLNDYAYRINVGLDVGLLTVVLAIAITMLTIGYQALRAALLNPSTILRNE